MCLPLSSVNVRVIVCVCVCVCIMISNILLLLLLILYVVTYIILSSALLCAAVRHSGYYNKYFNSSPTTADIPYPSLPYPSLPYTTLFVHYFVLFNFSFLILFALNCFDCAAISIRISMIGWRGV